MDVAIDEVCAAFTAAFLDVMRRQGRGERLANRLSRARVDGVA
ncbi:hypothetical protein [Halomonas cerina]|uniref:Uncharacterized protein n=1 Tax=Halomonas cerina TaxID=447424 RepID=A0A839VEM9_9GAMM|nr:hypothetical protein [Halomonas cerina]MBB3192545.1 hypothetical protein [Halomonas cerina]